MSLAALHGAGGESAGPPPESRSSASASRSPSPQSVWPRGEAISRCREVIAHHSKSFALASRVFPPALRDRAAVVYTFCRRADDAVDHAPPGQLDAALARIRAELDSVYAGAPQPDITLAAFQEVVKECRIPRDYPEELLAGMAMDVRGTHYDTMDTLLLYCYRVAGTVGLMMSHVMGVAGDHALRNAVHLGLAMQLTNICRDVVEDWDMGRLYVPDEILADYGAGGLHRQLGGPFPARARDPMARAVHRLLDHAERYYRSGDRGLAALPWRCAFAVRAARLVYSAIGARIANADHDVTRGRAIVPGLAKLWLVGRAGRRTVSELPGRAGQRILTGRSAAIPSHTIRFPDDVLPL